MAATSVAALRSVTSMRGALNASSTPRPPVAAAERIESVDRRTLPAATTDSAAASAGRRGAISPAAAAAIGMKVLAEWSRSSASWRNCAAL